MNRLNHLVGWLLLLIAILLLSRGEPAAAVRRVPGGTRFLAYALGAETSLVLPLEPGLPGLKLVTWLSRPEPPWRDPRATEPYALDLQAQASDGAALHQQRVWTRTRHVDLIDEDGLREPSVWREDGRASVTDDRTLELDVGRHGATGATLTVRPHGLPDGAELLVVAFRDAERSPSSRLRILLGDQPEARAEAAARLGPFPWEDLPELWRTSLASRVWERLGAAPGTVAPPTALVVSSGLRDEWRDTAAEGVAVPPGGAIALNLEGAVELRAEWRQVDGEPLAPGQAPRAWLRQIWEDGTATARALAPDEAITLRLDPVEGRRVCSAQIVLDPEAPGPLLLRAHTRGEGPDRVWGDPPRLPVAADGAQATGPDLRNLLLHRAGPALSPVEWPIETPGEAFRLSLRVPLPPELPGLGELTPAPAATAIIEAVSADDRVVGTWSTTWAPLPSLFERYTEGASPATAAVSEPRVVYAIPPAEATRLRLRADQPMDVSARARRPQQVEPVGWPGYERNPDAPVTARYEPWTYDVWRARAPTGAEALAEQGRELRVDAQVRLELLDPALVEGLLPIEAERYRERVERPAFALDLPAPYELIAEPAADGSGERARLGPAPVQARVGSRLSVDYRVAAAAVGATARLRVGERIFELPLPASAGTLRLDDLSPGAVELALDGVEGLFLAAVEGRWSTRRVIRLDPGQTLRLPLRAVPGPVVVLPYAASGTTHGQLSWRLDGVEAPAPGLYERLTEPTGAVALSPRGDRPAAIPLTLDQDALVPLAPAVAWQREERRGRGALTLRLSRATQPIWLRVVVPWPGAETAASNWRVGDLP